MRISKILLIFLLHKIHRNFGNIILFIDNYDKLIIDTIRHTKLLFDVSNTIKLLYSIIDSFDNSIKFMMITGEEKFNRTGVFSTLENIEDISNIKEYSDLLGFTELEVEYYFSRWLKNSSRIISNSRSSYLDCLREYHNQFNFED